MPSRRSNNKGSNNYYKGSYNESTNDHDESTNNNNYENYYDHNKGDTYNNSTTKARLLPRLAGSKLSANRSNNEITTDLTNHSCNTRTTHLQCAKFGSTVSATLLHCQT